MKSNGQIKLSSEKDDMTGLENDWPYANHHQLGPVCSVNNRLLNREKIVFIRFEMKTAENTCSLKELSQTEFNSTVAQRISRETSLVKPIQLILVDKLTCYGIIMPELVWAIRVMVSGFPT